MFNLRNQRIVSRDSDNAPTTGPQIAENVHDPAILEQYSSSRGHGASAVLIESELDNLMKSVQQQAVDINCEASRFSDLASRCDLLSSRVSTLQPLVSRLIENKAALEVSVAKAAAERDRAERRIAELDAELQHFRPLVRSLEEDLRAVNVRHQQAQSTINTLEGQIVQVQSESNALIQKLGTAETQVVRLKEENLSLKQRALEHATLRQNVMRETAELRSTSAGAVADLERQNQQIAQLTEKLLAEKELSAKAAAQIASLELRQSQTIRELEVRMTDAEEREQKLINTLAAREKRIYDLEVRHSAVTSKVDFLTRMNEGLREEVRTRVDHAGMLEASNKQLLEAMSAKALNDDEPERTRVALQAVPTLRAVQGGE